MKTVRSGLKCSIKPENAKTREKLLQFLGCRRYIYNHFLEKNIEYKDSKNFMSYYDMTKELTEFKHEEEVDWLCKANAQMLQQGLKDLSDALVMYKVGKRGFPIFRSRNKHEDTMRFPQAVTVKASQEEIEKGHKIVNGTVYLPKIGDVPCRLRDKIWEKEICQATVTYDRKRDRFYVSFSCFENIEEFPLTGKSVGIDVGSVRRYTDSEGNVSVSLRFRVNLKRLYARAIREQQKLSEIFEKFKAGGKKDLHLQRLLNRKRTTLRTTWRKIRNIRKDINHKESIALIKEFDLIAAEAMKLSKLTKSAKGTVENPGKNVKQKSGLNRNLLSNCLGEFSRMLTYKAEWYGKKYIQVDSKYTSQKCSECGHIDSMNRRTQAGFKCLRCGHTMNADHNAAKNILASAFAKTGV